MSIQETLVGDAVANGRTPPLEARFHRHVRAASQGLAAFAGVLAVLSALLTTLDVLLRQLFGIFLVGVIETQSLGIAVIAFATLAYTMSNDAHSRVDLAYAHFPATVRTVLAMTFPIWAGVLFGVVAWQMAQRGLIAYARQEATATIEVPAYPVFAMAALGGALLVLVLVSTFLTAVTQARQAGSRRWRLQLTLALALGVLPFAAVLLLRDLVPGLDRGAVGAVGIAIMALVLFAGFPASFTMGLIGYLGMIYLFGNATALKVIQLKTYDSVEAYFLSVIPFFIIMGLLIFKSGIGEKLYLVAQRWFGHHPGGLAIGTVFGCTGFAAMTGDSLSGTATMGTIALPEMERYGYDKAMASGAIAAGGTLGILIPPSLGFVFYGLITEQSVGKLLMAGLLPGLLMSALFAVTIYIRCRLNPALGPRGPRSGWGERFTALWPVLPFMLLAMAVMGGIYVAAFTPTEAGAIGLVGAFILALTTRRLTFAVVREVVMHSMELIGMIMAILITVSIFGHFIAAAGLPIRFAELIGGLEVSRWAVLTLVLLLYLVLGMFMNIVPMILLTMPIIFPTIVALDFDPIWFGVIMVIMMEMGTITPPVGINVFVLHGVARHIPMAQMFRGIVPFVLCMVAMILLLCLFPQIALFIPDSMDLLKPVEML